MRSFRYTLGRCRLARLHGRVPRARPWFARDACAPAAAAAGGSGGSGGVACAGVRPRRYMSADASGASPTTAGSGSSTAADEVAVLRQLDVRNWSVEHVITWLRTVAPKETNGSMMQLYRIQDIHGERLGNMHVPEMRDLILQWQESDTAFDVTQHTPNVAELLQNTALGTAGYSTR